MAYQLPQLVLVGSATGLVLGNSAADVGTFSDNKNIAPDIVEGNSRFRPEV